ncbi:hypothetical protein JCM3770_001616 [Rhodotorula araucariae]
MYTPRLELHAVPGSGKHDLASLDPQSLVAASYLQLLHPGAWTLVPCSDPTASPSGALPFLKTGTDTVTGSAILAHLVQTSPNPPALSPSQESDAQAFAALLDSTLLPLVLHSLYSLPSNWLAVRALLAASLPFPSSFYRPNALRQAAHDTVDATHPDWWGLGGEADREQDDERRRKKALLETGIDGIRERKEQTRRDGKERVKKTFGEGKIVAAARELFTALETTLASSSTPYFFSSSSPTPIDAHLSSLLSLLLFLPLPTPLLGDLLNASFPRLWAHTALLRRSLWAPESAPPPRAPSASASAAGRGNGWTGVLRALAPWHWVARATAGGATGVTRRGVPVPARAPPSAAERAFAQKRTTFLAVCAVAVVGWAAGTGQIPIPGAGRLGRLLLGPPGGGRWVRLAAGSSGGDEDDDGGWAEDEDDEDEDEDDGDDDE